MSTNQPDKQWKYDFFLSYRSADLALATRVHDALTAAHYRVFMQKNDIAVGASFLEEISRGLEQSQAVIALLTPEYFGSGYTDKEFWAALKLGKLIIARVGQATLPALVTHEVYQDLHPEADDATFATALAALAQRRPHPFKEVEYEQNIIGGGVGFPVALDQFVGRQEDLAMLDRAWHSGNRERVVTIIADGGFGKTTMVQKWMLEQANPAIQRANLFSYSFDKQSHTPREQPNASSDASPFLQAAVDCLLHRDPEARSAKPPQQVDKLVDFLHNHPTIIFLDGLEPMQAQREGSEYGTIPNDFLRRFITDFTNKGQGMLIITSRVPVMDLRRSGTRNPSVVEHPLKSLSVDESLALLRTVDKLQLSAEDCRRFAQAVECHPLTLSIYGPELARLKVTRLENFHLYKDLIGPHQTTPGRIKKFLRSVIPGLGPDGQNTPLEDGHQLTMADRAVLFSISLFDYPPTLGQLRLFFDRGPVPEVSEALFDKAGWLRPATFSENRLVDSLGRLRNRRLLFDPGVEGADTVPRDRRDLVALCQMHPLVHHGVREIFLSLGERPDATPGQKKAWKRANWQMYQAITRSVKTGRPDQRHELLILYSAIPFGVRAGEGLKAGWMYGRRCLRGFRAYSTNNHGLIYSDVEALSYYFKNGWESVREDIGLNSYARAQAQVWAGILLCGTNNYVDGRELMVKGIEAAEKSRNFVTAARNARNLSNACVLHGDLQDALGFAQQALGFLDANAHWRNKGTSLFYLGMERMNRVKVNLKFQRMATHVFLGSILHYLGETERAAEQFRLGEDVHRSACPEFPELRTIWCLRYCEHLIDQQRWEEAAARANSALIDPELPEGWGEGGFAAPFVKLALVQAQTEHWESGTGDATKVRSVPALLELLQEAELGCIGEAVAKEAVLADNPVERERKHDARGGRMSWSRPLFRLARARLLRLSGDFATSLEELERALDDCADQRTKLFEPDVHLEQARTHLLNRQPALARQRLLEARSKAQKMNCRSRERLIHAMDGQLAAW